MCFSVLMSVYKKENPEYFSEALKSILHQTLPPDEIVLIQDGMITEELEKVIENYQKRYPMFKIYQFKENVQLGRALAKGVELCSNELVARMDTDDIAMPDRFEKQYVFMKTHPQIAVCGGWLEEFDIDGNYSKIKYMPEGGKKLQKYAKYRNPLNHMTVMFRRSEVLSAGNYRHFPLLEDYDLWCRMLAKRATFFNLQTVLVRMRTGNEMYERRGGKKYFIQYRNLRKEQRKLGLLCMPEHGIALVFTAVMTLLPTFLRKLVYRKVLRKGHDEELRE